MAKLFITFFFCTFSLISSIISTDLNKKCAMTVCRRGRRSVTCPEGTLLIWNATSSINGQTSTQAFQNIRRMCMGKTWCDVTNLCQRYMSSLRIMYSCVNESEPIITCSNPYQNVTHPYGVLRNSAYPSTDTNICDIEIKVPKNSFIRITIHDLERRQTSSFCDGGLKLTTTNICKGFRFQSDICDIERNSSVIVACGDVYISVKHSLYGFRYFLTYEVTQMNSSPQESELNEMFSDCPQGLVALAQESDRVSLPFPSMSSTVTNAEVLHPKQNSTLVAITQYRSTSSVDYTERTVFYAALAVAALSLSALIAVTIVCIRRQRLLKLGGAHIDLATLLGARSLSNTTRPLPLVSSRGRNCQRGDQPRLEDGYSIVADEIPYSRASDDHRSPAYAEVEDNLNGSRTIFRFGSNETHRLNMPRKSIDNVYSELGDAKDKNVYNEIQDDIGTWHSQDLSHNDQKKLIKESRPTLKSGGKIAEDDTVSFENAYAFIDVRERRCSSSGSQKSDSDGSLGILENEIYEPFQSAHV